MRTCGILSAALLALIAVPTLVVSILYNGIAQTVLVSPTFVASISPESLQTRYQQLMPTVLQRAVAQPDISESLMANTFSNQAVRATAIQILPDLLDSNDEPFTVPVIQEKLDNNLTPLVSQAILNSAPCTPTEETALGTQLANNTLPEFRCAPSTSALQQQVVDATARTIRTGFDTMLSASNQFSYTNQDVANRINEIRAGALQSIMLPATLMIMIVALAVRSRRQLFGWASIVLIASAAIGLPIMYASRALQANEVELWVMRELYTQADILLPVTTLLADSSFGAFGTWSTRAFMTLLGVGALGAIITTILPKPVITKPRTSQPLGPQVAAVNDGSTHRVKTDFETDALFANTNNTLQLPPGLDTGKLTFGRRLPKIPQPTQQITDMIPAGDHTTPIPVDGQTTHLDDEQQTQELGPKQDNNATQRTDEHRF